MIIKLEPPQAPFKVSFEVPDHPTVRQQLAYFGGAAFIDPLKHFARLWEAALALLNHATWKCKECPDPNFNIDKETDPDKAHLIVAVGSAVKEHMDKIEAIEKNS